MLAFHLRSDFMNQQLRYAHALRFPIQLMVLGLCTLGTTQLVSASENAAAGILPEGRNSQDHRLGDLKDLDGYFPLEVPASKEQWEVRRDEVKRRILVSLGLWPMPARPPVTATVHGKVDRDDYTVERAYLESYPGFYVTGSLYRPKGTAPAGGWPVVLSPHGHWSSGRFYAHSEGELKRELETGAEEFEVGGRYPLQARCVQLARMGCIVFHYDMIGYADSQQISQQVAHRHSDPRPELESQDRWGFYTSQAEMRLQNIMGLQTFGSIRALDWLCSLPEVDEARVAVTGASGGGTQTMILCAIDDRPAVSFPAVMVSTAMQGGCTCENACCLRVGTGNVEFAALFAPKPLAMSAADDWTKELVTKGLPELQKLYQLLGVPDRVMAASYTQFPHNYNSVSRHAMYGWFNQHLQLGISSPRERDFVPLTEAELTVFDDEHPRPPGGLEFEVSFLKAWDEWNSQQLAAVHPKDRESLEQFQTTLRPAWDTLLSHGLPSKSTVTREKLNKIKREGYWEFHDLLRSDATGAEIPTVFLLPDNWNHKVVLWLDGRGKAALFHNDGTPGDDVKKLMSVGTAIAALDMFDQGELTTAESREATESRRVGNSRDFAGYTFGYNPTVFAWRVQDAQAVLEFMEQYETKPEAIHVVGRHGAGPIAAALRALVGPRIAHASIDTQGFRFAKVGSWRDKNFVPGAIKYGDLPGLLALSAPAPLEILGEQGEVPPLVRAAYEAAGASAAVQSYSGVR
jgi:dienelactone hydrolase